MTERQAGATGIAAFLVFWIALFAFGAARPDYSHFTKAISELGVIGAPHALAWNLIGFIMPGLLLAICGAGLAAAIDGRRGVLWWLLVSSGTAFAGTGFIPAEMHDGSPLMQSPLTMGHVLMSFLSAILWVAAALLVVGRAKRNPDWSHMWVVSAALALAGIAGTSARALPFFEDQPGLAQRVSLGFYFVWYLTMALYMISAVPRARRVSV